MKRNLVGAVALIIIGLLFLAKNLGWTDLDLGQLLSTWWPAILIAVGIGMLFNPKSDKS